MTAIFITVFSKTKEKTDSDSPLVLEMTEKEGCQLKSTE